MSLRRKIVRSEIHNICESLLDAHKLSPAEIRSQLMNLKKLANEGDPRTRSICSKFLVEHDFAVFQHEHPAVQKSEVKIEPLKITVECIKAGKK